MRIRQAATENEMQRVWKEFQEKPVSIKLHKKTWKFAHPVQTYLFIGTDKSGNEDAEGEEYHGSMADALMLVVVDEEEKAYGILQLNRRRPAALSTLAVQCMRLQNISTRSSPPIRSWNLSSFRLITAIGIILQYNPGNVMRSQENTISP